MKLTLPKSTTLALLSNFLTKSAFSKISNETTPKSANSAEYKTSMGFIA